MGGVMCDEYVWAPCEDEETGDFVAGCPFWNGVSNGCCLLVTAGMEPEDCPMDSKFQWWGYNSRTAQSVFTNEQVNIMREWLLKAREKGEAS